MMNTETAISERQALAILNGATHYARVCLCMSWTEELRRAQATPNDYTLMEFLTNLGYETSADVNMGLSILLDNKLACITCIGLTKLALDMTVSVWGYCEAHR